MDPFWDEFETGEIHFRDKWQFELKSEFSPIPGQKQSEYTQEFFVFIPTALQINAQTYTKNDFFRDQTNLIRLQTPIFTFEELLNPFSLRSPLVKLKELQTTIQQKDSVVAMEQELKLFANICNTSVRNEVYQLVQALDKAPTLKEILNCKQCINELLLNIEKANVEFSRLKETILKHPEGLALHHIFGYIQDAISFSLNSSLTVLLEALRLKADPILTECDNNVSDLLLKEKKYRENKLKEPSQLEKDAIRNEAILHQSGLLNKFILDALQLKTQRQAVDEKYRSIIGSFAAALAMAFYLTLFIWQGAVFVINSLPFILFSILIYVVKDRLKEELKSLSYKHVFKWFPDYTTEISLPNQNDVIGIVNESFSFVNINHVPMDISHLRNQEFHSYLEMIKRQEQVIHYKRKIIIYGDTQREKSLKGLNILFRYDIHNFLIKASNPYEPYTVLDSETLELSHISLPKVYHINIILKNTYRQPDLTEKVEWKKFRIVADKDGIKRIQNVTATNGNGTVKGNGNGIMIGLQDKTSDLQIV
ncbi:MAG: hypothetical protein H0W50_07885 [Parachlamydiaceae bacterium]|nr:hypothetical protein [Parachlamydiaceae bacterium]